MLDFPGRRIANMPVGRYPRPGQRLARFVWLALDGADVVFNDNYFDVPAGRTMTVRVPALDGWTAERVRASLRVRSLVDSFREE